MSHKSFLVNRQAAIVIPLFLRAARKMTGQTLMPESLSPKRATTPQQPPSNSHRDTSSVLRILPSTLAPTTNFSLTALEVLEEFNRLANFWQFANSLRIETSAKLRRDSRLVESLGHLPVTGEKLPIGSSASTYRGRTTLPMTRFSALLVFYRQWLSKSVTSAYARLPLCRSSRPSTTPISGVQSTQVPQTRGHCIHVESVLSVITGSVQGDFEGMGDSFDFCG